jgi:tetratricopeptide (TPR) repeat protein
MCDAYSSRRQEVLTIVEELGSLTTRLGDDVWSAHASIAEAAYLDAESRPEDANQVMASHLDRLRRLEHPELSLLLRNLAWGSILLGDYEQAEEMIDEQELIGQHSQEPLAPSYAMTMRGMLAHYRGDLHTAEQLLLQGLGELHRFNHIDAVGNSLRELAQVSLESAAFEQAAIRAGKLIDVGHDTLIARDMAEGHVLLARAELGRRDIEAAADAGGEALQIALDNDDTWALALLTAATGQLAWTTGDPASAATLHAAAETLRAQIGFAHPKHRAQELEHEYLHLSETLGADSFHDTWHHGADTDRTQLVANIRRVLASTGT